MKTVNYLKQNRDFRLTVSFSFLLNLEIFANDVTLMPFFCHSGFWINTVCPLWVARSRQRRCFSLTKVVFTERLCLPSHRCISEPVVPAGDHLWSGSFQRLPLCVMEVVLGATEWPLPPRCSQGGALPGRRPTACPNRGEHTEWLFSWLDWASFHTLLVSTLIFFKWASFHPQSRKLVWVLSFWVAPN